MSSTDQPSVSGSEELRLFPRVHTTWQRMGHPAEGPACKFPKPSGRLSELTLHLVLDGQSVFKRPVSFKRPVFTASHKPCLKPNGSLKNQLLGRGAAKTFRLRAKGKGPGQAVSKQRAPVQQPATKEGVLGAKRGRPSSGETAKGLVLSLRKSAKAVKSSAA